MIKYLGILWSIPLVIVIIVMGFLLVFSYATLSIDSEEIVQIQPNQLKFEIYHDGNYIPIIDREDPERYTVKLYEYHEKVDAARERIFKTK